MSIPTQLPDRRTGGAARTRDMGNLQALGRHPTITLYICHCGISHGRFGQSMTALDAGAEHASGA